MGDELKSAYELAIERLREQDRERGVAPARTLTDAEKRQIAELRQTAKAKLAQLEIMHRRELADAKDAEEASRLREEYETDRARVQRRLEDAVEKIRSAGA